MVVLTANASLATFPGAQPVAGPFLLSGPLVVGANATLDLGGRSGLLQLLPGAQLMVWQLVRRSLSRVCSCPASSLLQKLACML